MRPIRSLAFACLVVTAAVTVSAPRPARAESGAQLARSSAAALNTLCAKQQVAKLLRQKAKAILVFPSIVKAGFMFGGQIGEGTLIRNGRAIAFYSSVAASYGFQAGIQTFGYALFFMNEAALANLDASAGFEIGVGPSIVVMDEGMGRSVTTSTVLSDVYAFIFSQRGLMGGVGVQGSKITRIEK